MPNWRQLTKEEALRLLGLSSQDDPDEPTFEDERWVRIHADHGMAVVWHQDGASGSVDSLPVAGGLIDRLERWQQDFERIWDSDDGATPIADITGFCIEGRAIAHAVKQALPDWTVLYFDEERWEASRRDPDTPHSAFTYEIMLVEPFERSVEGFN